MKNQGPVVFRPELVHPTAFIAPGAVVVGDVTLEEESSVWFNAVLRGDMDAIRIGPRTNVQDGAVLHADEGVPCTLGAGVTVGHLALVHGATVGDNVLIGMRSVVMNGAVIGENSLIGAGALVKEGMVVPPGSLVVGMPARVARELKPEHIERIRQAAEHYVANARRYRQPPGEASGNQVSS
jgi:carbonic anhydrase/acetyltransferase-like protein (isoleucine patch superfamily)